ncbi:MAG: fatty acid desaturase family protein [Saprospiraceae bacterium]
MIKSSPSIKFAQKDQAEFFSALKVRINSYFEENKLSQKGNVYLYIKSIVFLTIYLLPISLILFDVVNGWGVILAYALMGLGVVGIGMSIMHDAIHGSYSKIPWLNNLMGRTIDLVGGNATSWKIQHNVLHHTFTNLFGFDEDIEDKPILRLSPHGKLRKIHRYQHYYAILLYGLTTLSWVTMKDFKQLKDYSERGLLQKVGASFNSVLFEMIFFKALYFMLFLILPFYLNSSGWMWVLAGFFTMHFIAGAILTTIFQLAHVVEETEHPEVHDDGVMENTWAIHQLKTTSNFARNNRILSWYIGGLNYQIEHHLFPNISHVHYRSLSTIVKRTAKEFGIPYNEYRTLSSALSSHFRVLKMLGRGEFNNYH